jgi:putative ABC transport system permease protein
VVKDFHHDHFMREIDPVVFLIGKEETFANLVMRVEKGKAAEIKSLLENEWKKNYPETACTIVYQDESFNNMFDESKGILRVFLFTTTVALLMSCIGLFGLASQRLQLKQKEICIRKIFGVPLTRAVLLVNGNFLLLIAVASIVASPISYLLLNELLDSIYLFRMDVGVIPFIISYWLMALTILVTLSGKIFQIAKTNPALILRNE